MFDARLPLVYVDESTGNRGQTLAMGDTESYLILLGIMGRGKNGSG